MLTCEQGRRPEEDEEDKCRGGLFDGASTSTPELCKTVFYDFSAPAHHKGNVTSVEGQVKDGVNNAESSQSNERRVKSVKFEITPALPRVPTGGQENKGVKNDKIGMK